MTLVLLELWIFLRTMAWCLVSWFAVAFCRGFLGRLWWDARQAWRRHRFRYRYSLDCGQTWRSGTKRMVQADCRAERPRELWIDEPGED